MNLLLDRKEKCENNTGGRFFYQILAFSIIGGWDQTINFFAHFYQWTASIFLLHDEILVQGSIFWSWYLKQSYFFDNYIMPEPWKIRLLAQDYWLTFVEVSGLTFYLKFFYSRTQWNIPSVCKIKTDSVTVNTRYEIDNVPDC